VVKEYDFQIIANLLAGRGLAGGLLEELKIFLQKNSQSFRVLSVGKPTPISKVPEDGSVKIKKAVICLGGDGTVSETVGYVLDNHLHVPIAVIPTGTSNIISTVLQPKRKTNDFDFILNGRVKQVDVGVADFGSEKDFFLMVFGLGFEEKFLKLVKEKLKNRLGMVSYLLAALSELLVIKKIPVVIKVNGKEIRKDVALVAVFNLKPILFKIFPLFHDSRIIGDDGILNLYYIEYKNYLQAVLETLCFHFIGVKNMGLVKTISGKNFQITSPVPTGAQIDGELKGNLPVTLSLNEEKCSFLIPF